MDLPLKNILDELRDRFQALYGERLVHLILFGSQARAQAEPDSDIDVLVVLRGSVGPGVEIARTGVVTASLSLQHDVVISCTFISFERFVNEHSPLLLNIHREGMAI